LAELADDLWSAFTIFPAPQEDLAVRLGPVDVVPLRHDCAAFAIAEEAKRVNVHVPHTVGGDATARSAEVSGVGWAPLEAGHVPRGLVWIAKTRHVWNTGFDGGVSVGGFRGRIGELARV